jgi:hypothetical protein
MKRTTFAAALVAGTALGGFGTALAGQAPYGASAPNIPISLLVRQTGPDGGTGGLLRTGLSWLVPPSVVDIRGLLHHRIHAIWHRYMRQLDRVAVVPAWFGRGRPRLGRSRKASCRLLARRSRRRGHHSEWGEHRGVEDRLKSLISPDAATAPADVAR